MYKQYFKNCLDGISLSHMNKSAPEGLRWCNVRCQDFKALTEFPTNGKNHPPPTCKDCMALVRKVDKKIEQGLITLEEFQNNPSIIDDEPVTQLKTTKVCSVCSQTKFIDDFTAGKAMCKSCKYIQSSERNNKDIDTLYEDVNNIKNNLPALETFLRSIPKDRLIKVVSHFQIGRQASDRKEHMINKCMTYFKSIVSPSYCKGGCGAKMRPDMEFCNNCNKEENSKLLSQKIVEFDNNIDNIIESLTEIQSENLAKEIDEKYNREQCFKIGRKMEISQIRQKQRKAEIVTFIVEEIKKKQKEAEKETEIVKIEKTDLSGTITLNNIVIYSRADGMINATALCKAGGKKFNDWMRLESTKELIKAKVEDLNSEQTGNFTSGIPALEMKSEMSKKSKLVIPSLEIKPEMTKIIDIQNGGDYRKTGSWIHPDLAGILATWISPKFAVKVGKWIRELALTGSVTLGSEKTEAQLLQLQNDYNLLKDDHKSLTAKHSSLLRRRNCYKFEEGQSFYIVEKENNTYKIGITKDINERLGHYRTLEGQSKLRHLVFCENSDLIERMLLSRFAAYREQNNHEVLVDIDLNQIIHAVNVVLDFGKFPSHTVSQEQLDKYNTSIDREEAENQTDDKPIPKFKLKKSL